MELVRSIWRRQRKAFPPVHHDSVGLASAIARSTPKRPAIAGNGRGVDADDCMDPSVDCWFHLLLLTGDSDDDWMHAWWRWACCCCCMMLLIIHQSFFFFHHQSCHSSFIHQQEEEKEEMWTWCGIILRLINASSWQENDGGSRSLL